MHPPEAAVADAGPLIHLDELAVLDVLSCYGRVWVPVGVGTEVERHRPGWQDRSPNVLAFVDVPADDVVALRERLTADLDPGESAALAFWNRHRGMALLCDDLEARRVAAGLGAPVIGTIGLLVQAARLGAMTKDTVLSVLRAIPDRTTLHIRRELIQDAVRRVSAEL
jgi:predicted nucleic acid-binding protein